MDDQPTPNPTTRKTNSSAKNVEKQITPAPLPYLARIPTSGIFEDDWRARPTRSHPYPVILIHGTGVTKSDWKDLGADLRQAGYAVWAPDFGNRSTQPVAESAAQIAAYIDAVLQVTGAEKVILVGHSQGGVLARFWMHHLGGAQKTHHLVCLAVPNHGTTPGGIISSLTRTAQGGRFIDNIIDTWFGPSGFELLDNSPLIEELNAHAETLNNVYYSCIATKSDVVISPPESCFLAGENVHNIFIQDRHHFAVVMHEDMPKDARVRALILEEINQYNDKATTIETT
ncbi:lipase family alpha/beta hydrolase [Corynebacterium kutscheri]|uniref:lipase family alpha/beta hydrolase n=1 Tax=Corynebacterium kutscheri TaxID=35755 RepID=UPI0037C0182E